MVFCGKSAFGRSDDRIPLSAILVVVGDEKFADSRKLVTLVLL